jgi:hypothetical protein
MEQPKNDLRKERIFSDMGNIRNYFCQHPYLDIQLEHLDIDKNDKYLYIGRDSFGQLGIVFEFESIHQVMRHINISHNQKIIDAISSKSQNSNEKIYQLLSPESVLISSKIPTGEIVFMQSSMDNIPDPENKDVEQKKILNKIDDTSTTDIDEVALIPETRLHFRFIQEWFNYQELVLKKYRRQQRQNNDAV